MTNWVFSTSLKNTSWPLSGHLIQRFSGESRRLRKLRIFGRTTLEIQFIENSQLPRVTTGLPIIADSVHIIAQGVAARQNALKLWRFLLGRANAAGQLCDKPGHGFDRARRRLAVFVEAVLYGVDQRRTNRDTLGSFGEGAGLLRGADAEADRHRQPRVALDPRHRGVDLVRVGRGRPGNTGDRDVIDKA